MDQSAIIERVRSRELWLKSLGVLSVSLFGSAARGDAGDRSDIDIAVRLADGFSTGGFDYFARLDALRNELAIVLKRPVDVVEEPVSDKHLQAEIDRDRIVAFV